MIFYRPPYQTLIRLIVHVLLSIHVVYRRLKNTHYRRVKILLHLLIHHSKTYAGEAESLNTQAGFWVRSVLAHGMGSRSSG